MGVNLRRGKIRMSQQLLYGVKFGSVVKHVRGKCVPQHVGAFLVQSCHFAQIFVHQPIDQLAVDWFTLRSYK